MGYFEYANCNYVVIHNIQNSVITDSNSVFIHTTGQFFTSIGSRVFRKQKNDFTNF